MIGLSTCSFTYISRPDKNGGFSMKSDGSVTVYRSSGKSAKKLKKLPYSFKALSARVLKACTLEEARKAMAEAAQKTSTLRRLLNIGEYDDKEISGAILHADAMKRAAKKKMNNLRQEELLDDKNLCTFPEELEKLKKKHRLDEDKDINEADMKYLKSLYHTTASEPCCLPADALQIQIPPEPPPQA